MPYHLLKPTAYDSGPCALTVREEPEMPTSPQVRRMIRSGYSAFDVPGEHKTLMSPDMIAELPKTIWMDEVPKTGVRDFHPVDSGFIVSQRVRDKLEELEPGAHGFYPVTLRHDRKKTELGTWYWHHLHQRPDILDLENTLFKNWVIKDGRGRMEPYVGLDDNSFMKGEPRLWEINPTRKGSDRLINFKHPPDGHLWRGSVGTDMRWITTRTSGPEWGCRTTYTDRLANELFCSDLFAAWMESEGVTGLRPRKIIEKPARSYVETQWKG